MYIKFLLEDVVFDLVSDGNYKSVLLLDKAFMDGLEIAIIPTIHVQLISIIQPSHHCILMVKVHNLWQYFIY